MSKKIRISGSGGNVEFQIQPEVSESGSATYQEVGNIRAPASILIYMHSPSRTFSINAKFVSRNQEEADLTFDKVNLLKSWRFPPSQGQAPEQLKLYGYGKVFNGINVVLTNYQDNYPVDTDYVEASNGSKIPIVKTVSISLKEAQSFKGLDEFDLNKFKNGEMGGY